MPRTKKIDSESAVQAAMSLFWKCGYNNLGTRQIEEETGITRFTLQTSYGGKKTLFLAALDSYLDSFETHSIAKMGDGSLESIANWFERRIEPQMMVEETNFGCFMLNSIVEFAAQDDEVNIRTARFFTIVEGGLRDALMAAKQNGKVAPDFDVDAMTQILLSTTIGLNIVIRSAADNHAGSEMANSIGTMIRDWEYPGEALH